MPVKSKSPDGVGRKRKMEEEVADEVAASKDGVVEEEASASKRSLTPGEAALAEHFYGLTDLAGSTRCKEAIALAQVHLTDEQRHYVTKRLVRGLVSPRLAARAGYSLALRLLLQRQRLQPHEVVQAADVFLSLTNTQATGTTATAVGRILLWHCLAVEANIDAAHAADELLTIAKTNPEFRLMITPVLDDLMCQTAGKEEGGKTIWRKVEESGWFLSTDWDDLSLHGLWLLFRALLLFPKEVAKNKLMTGAAGIHLNSPPVLARMVRIFSTVTHNERAGIVWQLALDYYTKATPDSLAQIWTSVMEEILTKSPIFAFPLIAETLRRPTLDEDLLLAVLSPVFLTQLATIKRGKGRAAQSSAVAQLLRQLETIATEREGRWRLKVAKRILATAPGLDMTTKAQFLGNLTQHLNEEEAGQLLKKVGRGLAKTLQTESGTRAASAHGLLSIAKTLFSRQPVLRQAILVELAEKLALAQKDEEVRPLLETVRDACLDSLLNIRIEKGGLSSRIEISQDNLDLLFNSLDQLRETPAFSDALTEEELKAMGKGLKALRKGLEGGSSGQKGLAVLLLYLAHWAPSHRVPDLPTVFKVFKNDIA